MKRRKKSFKRICLQALTLLGIFFIIAFIIFIPVSAIICPIFFNIFLTIVFGSIALFLLGGLCCGLWTCAGKILDEIEDYFGFNE